MYHGLRTRTGALGRIDAAPLARHDGAMSDSRAGSYRVRIAGQEIVLPDLDAVRRLSEGGQLGGAVEVRAPGSDKWAPLSSVLSAPPAKQDPWDVWEQADEVDSKEIWKEFSTGAHAAAPPRVDEAEELPPSAMAPVEDERARSPRMVIDGGKRGVTGKVIAFPARGAPREPPKVQGSHALQPDDLLEISEPFEPVEPVPLRPPPRVIKVPTIKPPPEPVAGTRWGRLFALAAVGALVLVGLRWWVVGQATERFPPPDPAPVAPAEAPVAEDLNDYSPDPIRLPTAGPNDPYAELEATLRGRLPQDIRDVSDGVTLEDALTVELHAMHLNVSRVSAPVTGWVGRNADRKPKVLDLRVYLRSDPDRFDSDLGAVGLVVGKYVQRYGYDLTRFDVIFDGLSNSEASITVDPESARALYLGRKDLLQFLKAR